MYKINEVFETIQGEASFTGTPSIFLRLQGCPVGCAWCDTKQTWDVDNVYKVSLDDTVEKKADSDHWAEATAEQVLALFKERGYNAKHVVITGGEPCMYDLNPVCELLHANGYSTQIETSGTFEILVPEQTWVTVSPKINMRGGYTVLRSAMQRADEIKHPVAMQKHVEELEDLFLKTGVNPRLVYLQPISQKTSATKLAIETCIAKNWRLSVQVHKYLGIS
ncbi:7-carboxy-7-deazaguanine synthase QueE [Pseudoalteromonas shioyasakiensis]|uniref:7-carboxy-7-deazaguanine synthase n=1 Tax=Pseudoalteromonas shioyasakiensis TaxID=1190813 RepID=A0ABT6U0V8_9GAMM|nr:MULTISPECIES: 7-carboxy-7-deazaguanine synthase QueE [Pseudoalteromonas]MDI4669808.1 7-carboxy-7-deazaguanine synthase QueE [Pseudoalteromonas shioyasakiensis]MDI4674607.1 7-carboxy-7-deazaguanine synthase QueE [Pseudoalteromonas shioyasakiensis]MDI4686723.1 7-carboxy-7-deazaguanine synthase QueE [Pseudoalteromonas shioyasakiensis]MDI4705318.1 7-carboxy-7-deazaguanine synthase QueE [Pseudoalteromonas shioyasakiensis]NUJ21771.1 7-carboxy-7-deazaguanine synthase QueE [Pseudoalteromonas sp. 08